MIVCGATCSVAWDHGGAVWLLPAFVALVSLIVLDWVRTVKFASYRDGIFTIKGYWKSQTIPASQLYSMADDGFGRTFSILLRFEPPTIFGPVVEVMPPQALWQRDSCQATADFLRAIVMLNKMSRQDGAAA
jgi:hypothetical protein